MGSFQGEGAAGNLHPERHLPPPLLTQLPPRLRPVPPGQRPAQRPAQWRALTSARQRGWTWATIHFLDEFMKSITNIHHGPSSAWEHLYTFGPSSFVGMNILCQLSSLVLLLHIIGCQNPEKWTSYIPSGKRLRNYGTSPCY